MKIKFNANTIVTKAVRKKGSTHEIPDDLAVHIVKRGFGEEVKGAEAPEPSEPAATVDGAAAGADKKKKKKGDYADATGGDQVQF